MIEVAKKWKTKNNPNKYGDIKPLFDNHYPKFISTHTFTK